MVARAKVCLRQLGGRRAQEVRFGRFRAHPEVTVARLIAGWGAPTALAARGRHVLAIQDTSEFYLPHDAGAATRAGRDRRGRRSRRAGALAHVMLALDAQNGGCLGSVAGRIWTRRGRVTAPHAARSLAAKEAGRWPSTAEAAKAVLAGAAAVTVIADRESDPYAEWARVPGPGFDLITRVMADRRLAGGGKPYDFGAALPAAGTRTLIRPPSWLEAEHPGVRGFRFRQPVPTATCARQRMAGVRPAAGRAPGGRDGPQADAPRVAARSAG